MLLRPALAAALAIGLVPATDTQSRTVALPADRALTLETTVGNVRIVGESRQDARIEIVRKAPSREQLVRIPVTIDEASAEVRIVAAQLEGGDRPRADDRCHAVGAAAGQALIDSFGRGTIDNDRRPWRGHGRCQARIN